MPQSLIFILFFESLFQFVYYLNFSSVGWKLHTSYVSNKLHPHLTHVFDFERHADKPLRMNAESSSVKSLGAADNVYSGPSHPRQSDMEPPCRATLLN